MPDQPDADIWVMPDMKMIDALVHVPEAQMTGGEIGPFGAVALGCAHLPGKGGVICLAIIGRDGQGLVASLGSAQWAALGEIAMESSERLRAGEFDQPRTLS